MKFCKVYILRNINITSVIKNDNIAKINYQLITMRNNIAIQYLKNNE